MSPNYWPRVYKCPYCSTTSNALICPHRSCIEADFQRRQRRDLKATATTIRAQPDQTQETTP